jgi:hypothetical protein
MNYLLYHLFDLYNIARIHKKNNKSNICILIAGLYHTNNIVEFLTKNNLYKLLYQNNVD